MSRSTKRTKDNYQGLNVRRLPRSELDDTTMRDLNRYDNRLDNNLRTVEKAKGVMLKSLESDKAIFMRGGIRSNKKFTVQIQNPGDSRLKRDSLTSTSHPVKYHSDTARNKKPVQGHTAATSSSSSSTTHQSQSTGNDAIAPVAGGGGGKQNKAQQQSQDINSDTREGPGTDKQRKSGGGENTISSNGYEGSMENKQKNNSSYNTAVESQYSSSRVYQPDPITSDQSRHAQQLHINDTPAGYRNSTTPSVKIEDYYVQNPEYVDGKMVPGGSQQDPYFDDYSRRSDFWEYLSTPKNPSRNLQKREQLEREFSSPALKSRATTPASKSAKGSRTLHLTASGSGSSSGPSPILLGTSSSMLNNSSSFSSSPTSPLVKSSKKSATGSSSVKAAGKSNKSPTISSSTKGKEK